MGGFILPALQFGLGLGTQIGNAFTGANAARRAGDELSTAGLTAANSVESTANNNANSILLAGGQAASGVENSAQAGSYGVTQAGAQGREDILAALKNLDPYSAAGRAALERIQVGLQEGGEFAQGFNGTDFRNDAGLAFRTKYGSEGIQNSVIARTGALGGNLGKALIDYNQGAASDEYQRAFDRFMANRKSILDPLTGLVDKGAQANSQILQGNESLADLGNRTALQSGNFLTQGAQSAGNFRNDSTNAAAALQQRGVEGAAGYRTDAASARAAGIVGKSNAFSNLTTNAARLGGGFIDALANRAKGLGGGFGGYSLAGAGGVGALDPNIDLGQ